MKTMMITLKWPLIGNVIFCLVCHHLASSFQLVNGQLLQTNANNNNNNNKTNGNISSKPNTLPASNSNESSTSNGVDEILRDTMQLLDSLDQRLDVVTGNNKTGAPGDKRLERQENFRMLNGAAASGSTAAAGGRQPIGNVASKPGAHRSLEEERRLTSLAEGFSSERRPTSGSSAAANSASDDGQQRGAELDPLVVASSDSQQQQQSSSSKKAARQLVVIEPDNVPLAMGSQSAMGSQAAASLSRFTDNDFSEKHIRFSLDLMRAVFSSQSYTSKSNSIDSFLISPVSIQMVLMMMHLGARGQTRRELANCLHLVSSAPVAKAAGNSFYQLKDDGSLNSSGSNNNNKLLAQQQLQANQTSAPNNLASNSGASNSATQNKNAKLTRRHQQSPIVASSNVAPTNNGHKQTASHHQHPHQQQQQQASNFRQQQQQATATQQHNNHLLQQIQQAQSNSVHEQFGSAMRQLLKDQMVVKALSSANQIFVQKDLPLMAQYEWAVKNYYGTDLKLVDFQNQNLDQNRTTSATTTTNSTSNNNNIQLMINDWIERQTKGKISNFLSAPVPSSTLLMALNVLFFKGDWQYKFDPADTDPDAWFTLTNGRTVKVPMMVNKLPLAHAHDPIMKASLIELPYKAQRLGLFILLPDEVNGIFETMQLLNPSSFANLISMMRKPTNSPSGAGPNDPHAAASAGINVRIPKFSIESSPRMSHILSQQLGLKTLFTPDQADLSGMFSPTKRTKQQLVTSVGNQSSSTVQEDNAGSSQMPAPIQVGLDELHHKAVLQVHEQGSVAAAASATIVERVGLFNGQYFEADHPFLLFLMDKQTGLVLFSGVFAGPAGQDGGGGGGATGNGQPTTDQQQHQHQTNGALTNATSLSPDGGTHLTGRSPKQATSVNSSS
uniref:Serpin B10 n=1 Tax=Aceria tosichella TaxID=561515 RepID=A0A6G1SKM9_9ACAR